jgi:hypothetical protein
MNASQALLSTVYGIKDMTAVKTTEVPVGEGDNVEQGNAGQLQDDVVNNVINTEADTALESKVDPTEEAAAAVAPIKEDSQDFASTGNDPVTASEVINVIKSTADYTKQGEVDYEFDDEDKSAVTSPKGDVEQTIVAQPTIQTDIDNSVTVLKATALEALQLVKGITEEKDV